MDGFEFTADDTAGGAMRVAIVSALYSSNGDARRAIQQGGLSINDERVAAVDSVVPALVADRYLVLRAGKKSVRIGRLKG
jgi:tyrosyl-tRNA synthetase